MTRQPLGYSAYQARSQWVMNQLGPPAHYRTEEMEDGKTALLVACFAPKATRSTWVYATNGIAERRFPGVAAPHVENPDWRLELVAQTEREESWVMDLLVEMARYPFIHRSAFAIGHTLPVSAPVRKWSGYLLSRPVFLPDEFNPMGIDDGTGDWTFFAQVVGLRAAELNEAIATGGPAFAEKSGLLPDADAATQQRTCL